MHAIRKALARCIYGALIGKAIFVAKERKIFAVNRRGETRAISLHAM